MPSNRAIRLVKDDVLCNNANSVHKQAMYMYKLVCPVLATSHTLLTSEVARYQVLLSVQISNSGSRDLFNNDLHRCMQCAMVGTPLTPRLPSTTMQLTGIRSGCFSRIFPASACLTSMGMATGNSTKQTGSSSHKP